MPQLAPGLGGGANLGKLGGGAGGKGDKAKTGLRHTGQRVPSVPVSDTVDLTTDQEGMLWLPTSMTPPECSGGRAEEGDDEEYSCESTVRFCLMDIAEYQQTPWKFPMAAMLQKKSLCNKSDNMRAFRLSTLRVSVRRLRLADPVALPDAYFFFFFFFFSHYCFCRLPHWPTSSTTTS